MNAEQLQLLFQSFRDYVKVNGSNPFHIDQEKFENMFSDWFGARSVSAWLARLTKDDIKARSAPNPRNAIDYAVHLLEAGKQIAGLQRDIAKLIEDRHRLTHQFEKSEEENQRLMSQIDIEQKRVKKYAVEIENLKDELYVTRGKIYDRKPYSESIEQRISRLEGIIKHFRP